MYVSETTTFLLFHETIRTTPSRRQLNSLHINCYTINKICSNWRLSPAVPPRLLDHSKPKKLYEKHFFWYAGSDGAWLRRLICVWEGAGSVMSPGGEVAMGCTLDNDIMSLEAHSRRTGTIQNSARNIVFSQSKQQ
jgi:hypothetical protein